MMMMMISLYTGHAASQNVSMALHGIALIVLYCIVLLVFTVQHSDF